MSAGPFRSRSFRWVWGGEAVSMVGDAGYEVVLAWLVLSSTGSPAALAAVVLAATLPRGLLLLLGGAITDRLSARRVMLGAHLVRGLTVAVLTGLAATGTLRLRPLVVAAVITGAAEAFFWPASGSILPTLVTEEDLPRANALVGSAEQASMLVGPLLGGALLAWAGAPVALGFNAATFFIAAATMTAAPRREAVVQESRLGVGAVVRSVRSGVGYARRTADLRIVLLLVGAAALSYSGLFAVGLPALARTYRGGSFLLGALFAAWGLGQLFGVLSAAVTGLPRRWGLLIIGVSTAEGMSFLIIGIRPDFAVALCLLALLGFCVAYSTDVALPTFVQATTPLTMLGRVNSLINLPRVVLAPASIAGMGLLAAADVRWPFFAAAIPMLLTGLGLAGNKHARAIGTDDGGP